MIKTYLIAILQSEKPTLIYLKETIMVKIIVSLFASLFLFAGTASAQIIGGPEYGWSVNFGEFSNSELAMKKWKPYVVKTTGHQPFSLNLKNDGRQWKLEGVTIGNHIDNGPALFSFAELHGNSTEENMLWTRLNTMSDTKGFENPKCEKNEHGVNLCSAALKNWTPAKDFYIATYVWRVNNRTFILYVHNAQPEPDKASVEAGIKLLISKIKML